MSLLDEKWVILIDWTEYVPLQAAMFHIEPLHRFQNNPPDERWKLYKIVNTANEAFTWLVSDEARIISKDNYKKLFCDYGSDDYGYEKIVDGKISRSKRIEVFERDGYRCQICGRGIKDGVELEVDHIVPRARGGSSDFDNLTTLCFDCNRGKSAKILSRFIESKSLIESGDVF